MMGRITLEFSSIRLNVFVVPEVERSFSDLLVKEK